MGAINATTNLKFKSSKELLATLKVDLESLDSMGVLNDQKYYRHIKYILNRLGVSTYQEYNSVIDIEAYTGVLPANFNVLHAAYRMSPSESNHSFNMNLGKFTYYIEETKSVEEPRPSLLLPPVFTEVSKVEYQTQVRGHEVSLSWERPQLMRLSARTEKSIITDNCINVGNGSANEFALDTSQNKVYTNFQKDAIVMQYYGMAVDEYNLPMVPDDTVLYEAVYTYIRLKIFEDLFYNNTVQDVQTKFQKAEIDHNKAFKEALFYVKLPSFQASINMIQNNKNRFSAYQLN